jgi:tetratricopeptide (TPR) repeat protein
MMNPSNEPEDLQTSLFRSQEGKERFLFQAESLMTQGLFAEAVSLARERLDLIPGDVDARIICGRALAAMGKAGRSLEIFEEIKKDILSWVSVFEDMGDILTGKGETERARICYQSVIPFGLDAIAAERLRKKIEALNGAERRQEDKLIDDVSRDFKTMTMVDLYVRQGHLDTAKNVLKEIMQSDPGNSRARKRLQEVEGLLAGTIPSSGESDSKNILQELERWQRHFERQKSHE